MKESCEGCRFAREFNRGKGNHKQTGYECRKYAPRPQVLTEPRTERDMRTVEYFGGTAFYRGGDGCGEYEAEDPNPTPSKLEQEWKQGYSEGYAKVKRAVLQHIRDAEKVGLSTVEIVALKGELGE